MAFCPNCGSVLSKDGVCSACGFKQAGKAEDVSKLLQAGKYAEAQLIVNEVLAKDPNNGKACLDSVRIMTKNFSEKPVDVNACLDMAVTGLTYASDKDKANVEFKLRAYFENLHLGGRGVENVFDLKSSVSGNVAVHGAGAAAGAAGAAAGGAASAGAAGAAASKGAKAPKAAKARKPLTKGKKIAIIAIAGVVVVGSVVGIIVGTTSGNKGGGGGSDGPSPQQVTSTYVTFDKQGGYGGDSYVTNNFNSYYYSISVPSKSGYTFKGYYTQSYGNGYQYYDQYGGPSNYQWDISYSSVTLYAYWEAQSSSTYTYVTFDKQGGSGGTSSAYNYYNSSYDSISKPTKSGYTFGGYYTSTGGYGSQYYDEYGDPSYTTWTNSSSSLTLYAKWTSSPTPVSSTYITFDKQGGSGGTSSVSNYYNQSYDSISVPSKTGYTFADYYTSTNGSGTQYYDENGYPYYSTWTSSSSSMTLYAKWTSSTPSTKTFNFVQEGTYGFQLDTSLNPNSSLYQGVYKSTNQGRDSTSSIVKITFSGYSTFKLYIRSDAESTYDYTYASEIDGSSDYNSAKSTTSGNQTSSTTLSSYTQVTYNCDGGEHYIYVGFKKDSSDYRGSDTGYFFFEK